MKTWLVRGAPVIVALAIGLWIGWWMADAPGSDDPAGDVPTPAPASEHDHAGGAAPDAKPVDAGEAATTWTCSMHPQVQMSEPGRCPICGMDLIPVARDLSGGPPRVVLSDAARVMAGIQTVPVERRAIWRDVSLVGEVVFDETRVARAAAWFGGRIERMYVDSVGEVVEKGDRLFTIYSPDLLVAQREHLQAVRHAAGAGAGPLGDAARRAAEASAERLRLWGLSTWQIGHIAKTGKTTRTVTVHAERGGTVIERGRLEGSYVDEGTVVYTIVDLSRVWVELRAYERDLPWLDVGMPATLEVDTGPGERFEGVITYIGPTIDAETRTATVRLEVDNTAHQLKPGAWARGAVRAQLPASPPPLVVPESAPLAVGDRAVVFVAMEGADDPTYLAREVRLGARGGGYQVVTDGLMEGELVVAEGAFKLDSVLQIRGDRSLMSAPPASDAAPGAETQAAASPSDRLATAVADLELDALPEAARTALSPLIEPAVRLADALAADDLSRAQSATAAALPHLRQLARALGDHPAASRLDAAATRLEGATDSLATAREAFLAVSDVLVPLVVAAHDGEGDAFQVTYCPMAAGDRGAFWLQSPGGVLNPYFGAEMLVCGVAVDTEVPPQAPATHDHDGGGAP